MASSAPPRPGSRGAPHGLLSRRPLPPWWCRALLSSFRLYGQMSRQLSTVNVQSYAPDASLAIPQSTATILPMSIAATRGEVRSVLSQFFVQQGMESTVAVRLANKSSGLIQHLVSMLRTTCKSKNRKVRELSPPEIRSTLLPYLSELPDKHAHKGGFCVAVSNFPNPPAAERGALSSSSPLVSTKNIMAVPPKLTHYLLDLGMDFDGVKNIVCNFPAFASYDVDLKVKPFVEQLLELGMPRLYIPRILQMEPRLCSVVLPDDLNHTLMYLETIGVDKAHWSKVVHRWPRFLLLSRQQVETVVSFLVELRVVERKISKIMFRAPHIFACSVDGNLRPTADYFRSIGADLASVMQNAPQAFGLNIEGKLKSVTQFFLDKGFSIEEVATMVNKFANIYTLRLRDNLLPKYEFYLIMEYPRHDLVKFPQYFGYSLERRIKPRHAQAAERGVRLGLRALLASTDIKFEKSTMLQMNAHEDESDQGLR